ncbi:INT5 protein, partial [Eubucco bourcierii]|nr:INT5 protein [Eubucco bourcierii]
RVLSCGLKDFCAHGANPGGDFLLPFPPSADKRVPKLASVVGILGHLAGQHSASIQQELLRMFHRSLAAPPAGGSRELQQQQRATVPFLLQLALMSPALLGTLSCQLVDSLQPPVLNQLQLHFSCQPREELEQLVGTVVHLICQTSAGAFRLLRFLLGTAVP